jgi:hypothetical protein
MVLKQREIHQFINLKTETRGAIIGQFLRPLAVPRGKGGRPESSTFGKEGPLAVYLLCAFNNC